MNPSSATRNSKEVPVDKESRRKAKGKMKKPKVEPDQEAEREEGDLSDRSSSGKVVDITI